MYKRLSAVLFPLVTVLLIGTIVWGYQENREKNAILIKAENQYQRAFHDLSSHIHHLHTELGNALAVNSTSHGFHRKCLINAWRLTSQAQSEINQLPLTLLPFHNTEEFLSKIARFTYQTAVRDLQKEPLTEDEMNTLKALYEHSKDISRQLQHVQSHVINENLRWMDVEIALAREDESTDNSVINGFKTVDKRVNEYEEVNWGPSVTSAFETNRYKTLSGQNVGPDVIRKKVAQFLGIPHEADIRIVENASSPEIQTYSVLTSLGNNQGNVQMDYTKKGGHLLWFAKERDVNERRLSLDQAIQQAHEFLKKQQYGELKPVNLNHLNHVAHITFATVQDDVIIYPQKISVKVALDNGEIIGLQAADYVYGQKQRHFKQPRLTLQEAKSKLNPEFRFTQHHLAVIENDLNEEVLCYQFTGKINGSDYQIYLNADTGIEEKIERIS